MRSDDGANAAWLAVAAVEEGLGGLDQGVDAGEQFAVRELATENLERTRPDLPLAPGHPAAQTHDYTRHGTTTLFAALDVLKDTVTGRCMQRHCHSEFVR